MIELYQFHFSHFCEKACWALDYKGLRYERRNLMPGLHMRVAKKLAGKSGLPILIDAGQVIQDSTAIIDFLDRKYPQHSLTPPDTKQAAESLEWEEYLDAEIGIPLRLWFYYHALPDRKRAFKFLLDGAPWYGRPYLIVTYPKLRELMIAHMNIHADPARNAEERLLAALDKLDDALRKRRFLVGDQFSRADLTACALLRPFCLPGKSNSQMASALPPPVFAMRDAHNARPYVGWVQEIYDGYRRHTLSKVA